MSPKNVICTFHSNWKFAKSNKSKNLHNLKCRNMQQSQKHFSVTSSFPGPWGEELFVQLSVVLNILDKSWLKVWWKWSLVMCVIIFCIKNRTFWFWLKSKNVMLVLWKYFQNITTLNLPFYSISIFKSINHYSLLLSVIMADVIRRNSGF